MGTSVICVPLPYWGKANSNCWRATVAPLRPEFGSKPAIGFGVCWLKEACLWSTGIEFNASSGMKFSASVTGSRRVMLPAYDASANHPPGSSYWNPAEYC